MTSLFYTKIFQDSIDELIKHDRYRQFVDISRICGQYPYAINNKNGQKIVVWCSNDYLAMSQNQTAINQSIEATKSFGLGSGGTRNISGTSSLIVELESEVASLHNKEAALVFSSGYVANDASITALAKIMPNLVIFSDHKNHASIICGIKNSRLEKNIFKHNDLNDLEKLLKKYPASQPKIIIFESVYSMDGDLGLVKEICELAKKYNALTYIDEVHSVGLYGKRGGGISEELDLEDNLDIIQGTFAKSYGCIGGYIAGSKEMIDAIRSNSSGFIFTTSLTPATIAANLANVRHLKTSSLERGQHHIQVKKTKEALKNAGIKIVDNQSHIISIVIGNAKKAKIISDNLLDRHNIYVQSINYPTVAINDERLRITPSALHSDELIKNLIIALKNTLENCDL
jgi:5-aminolevulinate synthase